MKDLIEISVNGKVVASHEMYLEGASPLQKIERVKTFNVSLGETTVVIESVFGLIDENDIVVAPPVMEEKNLPIPTIPPQEKIPTHIEIPIKTGKKMGRPKREDVAKVAEKIEKEGEFVPLEEAAKELKIEVPVATPAVVIPPIKSPATFAPTNARIAELGKLIKMFCKAGALKIEDVDVALLKANAFDIVENDSDEAIESGIKEAGRLMGA